MERLEVRLRPFDEADLEMCDRAVTDPDFVGPFEWVGFGVPQEYRRRWQDDRLLGASPYNLVVAAAADGSPVGWVNWRDTDRAGTEVDNIAEQRALERCRFVQEGRLRGHHFRDGHWRDSFIYGLIRDDNSTRPRR